MGQILCKNQFETDYWARALYHITGCPPKVVGAVDWVMEVSVPDDLLSQEACDAQKAIYDRNMRCAVVEVKNPTPSIAEREAAVKLSIHERAMLNQGRADESK